MKKKPVILQLLIKNTSTLDFTLPVFYNLRANSINCRIVVIVWYWNKSHFFRSSKSYQELLENLDVEIMSLNDFVPYFLKRLCGLIDNRSDRLSKKELSFATILATYRSLGSIGRRFSEYMAEKIVSRHLDVKKIFDSYLPDVVFYDLRKDNDFIFSKQLKRHLIDNRNIQLKYIPHAPHMRLIDGDYCDFDDDCRMPSNATLLFSHKEAQPWLSIPERKADFRSVGYPPFDNSWIKFLESKYSAKTKQKTIMYVGRRFLAPHLISNSGFDEYTLTYEAVLNHIKIISEAAELLYPDGYTFIFKPHPNVNRRLINRLLKDADIEDAEVSYETAFYHINSLDLVVTEPSTVCLMYAFAKTKVVIIDADLQEQLESRWDYLKILYSEFPKVQSASDIVNYYHNSTDTAQELLSMHVKKYFEPNYYDFLDGGLTKP